MGQAKTKVSIIVCGLDSSGKTTIINHMQPEEKRSEEVSATVGYTVSTFTKDKTHFTAFDMGGAQKFRDMWETYYASAQGIVFVIDSADELRLSVVKDELQTMLAHRDVKSTKVPILIYANKMDLDGAKTPAELTQMLELVEMVGDHPFNIFASDARKGVGLEEGMEWLRTAMLRQLNEGKKSSK